MAWYTSASWLGAVSTIPSEVLEGWPRRSRCRCSGRQGREDRLSIKRAEVDPWTTVEQRYQVAKVQGTITRSPLRRLRPHSRMASRARLTSLSCPSGTQGPKQVLRGDEVTVRIRRIESDRRRLGLSVRARRGRGGQIDLSAGGKTPSGIAVVEGSVRTSASRRRRPSPRRVDRAP